MKNLILSLLIASLAFVIACSKNDNIEDPKLIIQYTFDENQVRLDNFGNPSTIPSGNAAQTPDFKKLGVHSIELINSNIAIPTDKTIVYNGEITSQGGSEAIDFSQEKIISEGEVLVEIPIKDIIPGTYDYLRNSLSYQEYDIDMVYIDSTFGSLDIVASVASFIGFNTYVTSHTLNGETFQANENKLQGSWAFVIKDPVVVKESGNAAASTTVVNPLPNSPIPPGSCLVTGAFEETLTITGNETEDIRIEVSVSINNSFEWEDTTPDGKYEAGIENVVDMGVRGIKARIL